MSVADSGGGGGGGGGAGAIVPDLDMMRALHSERVRRRSGHGRLRRAPSALMNTPSAAAAIANLQLASLRNKGGRTGMLPSIPASAGVASVKSTKASGPPSFLRVQSVVSSTGETRNSGAVINASGGGGGMAGDMSTNREPDHPLCNIPLEVASYDGQVRITALNLLPLSPLAGVRLVQHPDQSEPTAVPARPRRRGWCASFLSSCTSQRVPMDTYVRLTLLPSGIGQQTDVCPNSGTDVTWKLPQRLRLFFDPSDPAGGARMHPEVDAAAAEDAVSAAGADATQDADGACDDQVRPASAVSRGARTVTRPGFAHTHDMIASMSSRHSGGGGVGGGGGGAAGDLTQSRIFHEQSSRRSSGGLVAAALGLPSRPESPLSSLQAIDEGPDVAPSPFFMARTGPAGADGKAGVISRVASSTAAHLSLQVLSEDESAFLGAVPSALAPQQQHYLPPPPPSPPAVPAPSSSAAHGHAQNRSPQARPSFALPSATATSSGLGCAAARDRDREVDSRATDHGSGYSPLVQPERWGSDAPAGLVELGARGSGARDGRRAFCSEAGDDVDTADAAVAAGAAPPKPAMLRSPSQGRGSDAADLATYSLALPVSSDSAPPSAHTSPPHHVRRSSRMPLPGRHVQINEGPGGVAAAAAAAGEPAPSLVRPLLLLEVICCAPGGDSLSELDSPSAVTGRGAASRSTSATEEDRLVASATLDLESFLRAPSNPARALLNLTDVETLEEQGQANIVVEYRPAPLAHLQLPPELAAAAEDSTTGAGATAVTGLTSVTGHSAVPVAAGYFHIDVIALIGLRDPFNEALLSDHADWALMRRMLLAVLLYLAVGVVFYVRVEGWSFLEAVYFCVVTATTTGYGDLRPTTTGSQVFTMFFVLVGIGMIAIAVGIAGGLMLERQEAELYRAMMAQKTRASAGSDPSSAAKGWFGPTTKRLLLSFLLALLVLWGGALGFLYLEPGLSIFDAIYLCVITFSTVGYGDIAPRSDAGRAFCIPWMVLSAMTATRIIGDVTNVYMTWNRNQRAKAVLKNSVQSVEDLAALDDDNSGEVSELEFLKHMLVKTNLAKQRDIDVICEQFKALDADGSGFLSAADFEQAAANKEKLRMGTHAVQTVE